jgi:glycosyltransferase involved in cell wall biosynthesis
VTRIAVTTNVPIGSRMGAQGIRAYHVARVLQQQVPDADVTLAVSAHVPCDLDPSSVPFRFQRSGPGELADLISGSDIAVTVKFPLKLLPRSPRTWVVLDLYTPVFTEMLEMSRDYGARHRTAWLESKRKNLLLQLAMADLVLCANERQRDLLAGIMATAGLIDTKKYDADHRLEAVLRIAPYGIRPHAPAAGQPILRGVHPGIGADDIVLLWNGTIIEWYDVETLIRAVDRVRVRQPNVRLVFMGTDHPDSFGSGHLQGMGAGAVKAAMALSVELGLLDTHVFFRAGWADNATAEQLLQEADIGVSTYFESLETRYAQRVRMMDLLWASLPVVCTRGDNLSEMVAAEGAGIAVAQRDVDALAQAIERMAGDASLRAECRSNAVALRERFRWECSLAPLVDFCRDPQRVTSRPQRKTWPVAVRAADWALSETHLRTRFELRGRVRRMMRRG